MSDSFSLKAGGDIRPSRFISLSADYTVLESNATDLPFGIAHDSTKAAPADGLASANHAELDDQVSYYKLGDSCLLEAGIAFSAGELLGPDAEGRGTTAIAAGDVAGAIALESAAAAGELVRVQVVQIVAHAPLT